MLACPFLCSSLCYAAYVHTYGMGIYLLFVYFSMPKLICSTSAIYTSGYDGYVNIIKATDVFDDITWVLHFPMIFPFITDINKTSKSAVCTIYLLTKQNSLS